MEPELKLPREQRMFDRFPDWKLSDYYPDPVSELASGKSKVVAVPLSLSHEQLTLELLVEPTKLYQPDKLRKPGRFALCTKEGNKDDAKIHQSLYDVSQLEVVLRQISRMPDRDRHHIWISQNTLMPYARNRRISSVMLLNAVWVDIDLAHPPEGFPADELPAWSEENAEQLARVLVSMCEDLGIPPPTQVVWTGGGLLARWPFEDAVPAVARPRWASLQKHLVKAIADMRPAPSVPGVRQWRWPVDFNANDASRILRLVNTVNPRWGTRCRVVYDTDRRYDFDKLADSVLPYTQLEVIEYRRMLAARDVWDENRQKAAEAGIRVVRKKLKPDGQPLSAEELIADEAVRDLWSTRLEFGRALLTERGGVREGLRNEYFWPMANALAWSCTSTDALTQELAAMHHQFFRHDGWTRANAMHSAGSVLKRLKEGSPYPMKTEKFLKYLRVTGDERNRFGHLLATPGVGSTHNKNRLQWKHGALGFEKISGLPFDEYVKEVRSRQAEAGVYAAQVRRTTHPPEVREKARELARRGLTQTEIADLLNVGQGTISKWLKA